MLCWRGSPTCTASYGSRACCLLCAIAVFVTIPIVRTLAIYIQEHFKMTIPGCPEAAVSTCTVWGQNQRESKYCDQPSIQNHTAHILAHTSFSLRSFRELKNILIFVYVDVSSRICVHVGRSRHRISWARVTGGCELWVLGTKSKASGRARSLLTVEPSPQAPLLCLTMRFGLQ